MVRPVPLLPAHPVAFPDPKTALEEPEGLLAAGGDLSPEWIVEAYALGIFPWFERDDEPIFWWSPVERGVIVPGQMRVTRSLTKRLRNSGCAISFDQRFSDDIRACADVRAQSVGTWITPRMQEAYCELHDSGLAHSVEVWQDGDLVGGLYGLSLGQMFFGESMFSRINDGSKLAFYYLNQRLLDWNFTLIDCQMMNPHLESLGVQPMHRDKFLALLADNDLSKTRLGSWSDLGSDRGADFGSTLESGTGQTFDGSAPKAQEPCA